MSFPLSYFFDVYFIDVSHSKFLKGKWYRNSKFQFKIVIRVGASQVAHTYSWVHACVRKEEAEQFRKGTPEKTPPSADPVGVSDGPGALSAMCQAERWAACPTKNYRSLHKMAAWGLLKYVMLALGQEIKVRNYIEKYSDTSH